MDSVSLEHMSAEELYQLALQRKREEDARRKQEWREELRNLKAEKKVLEVRQQQELMALEREIEALGGRRIAKRFSSAAPDDDTATETIPVTLALYEIVAAGGGEMATTEIRERAEAMGLDTHNISQTLAYLKRQGRLDSPRRGVYCAAE